MISTAYKSFCIAVITYYQTDSDRHLTMAMKLRNELIRSGEFSAEFLDGVQAGLTGALQ
jgi:hypothetical protein